MTTKQPACEVAARELSLYATNDRDLYRDTAKPVIANLARKVAAGTYDANKAPQAFANMALKAARKYEREFSGPPFGAMFPPATRALAAFEMLLHYDEQIGEEAERLKLAKRTTGQAPATQAREP